MKNYGPIVDSVLSIRLWRYVSKIATKAQMCRLLGLDPNRGGYLLLSRWESGEQRADVESLRRMTRLRLWHDQGLPIHQLKTVDWKGLNVEWSDPPEHDDLLRPFDLAPGIRFAFGSSRDSAQVVRDTMEVYGIDLKGHMVRLLGMDPRRSGYRNISRWFQRQREMGPLFQLRLLLLLLWAASGYVLSDMWAVDWGARTVDWWYGRKPTDTKHFPANPFDIRVPTPNRTGIQTRGRVDLAVHSPIVRMSGPGVVEAVIHSAGAFDPISRPIDSFNPEFSGTGGTR